MDGKILTAAHVVLWPPRCSNHSIEDRSKPVTDPWPEVRPFMGPLGGIPAGQQCGRKILDRPGHTPGRLIRFALSFLTGKLIPARVIATSTSADVALMQLERVPTNRAANS